MWIIDFGTDMSEEDAALYESPFEYIKENVKPTRIKNRTQWRAENWWLHGYPATSMRHALSQCGKFIGTSVTAKHRFFVWLTNDMLPSNSVVAIASDDDCMFGVLHSRFHTAWVAAMGTQLEDRPRYIVSTCFETFSFPRPTSEQRDAIATAARELNQLRENWRDADAGRTLTGLYNTSPTWLSNAHAGLDIAVADAYGWPADLPDHHILENLLALNLRRAGGQ